MFRKKSTWERLTEPVIRRGRAAPGQVWTDRRRDCDRHGARERRRVRAPQTLGRSVMWVGSPSLAWATHR